MAKKLEDNSETLVIEFKDLKNRSVQKDDLVQNDSEEDYVIGYKKAIDLVEKSFFRNVYNQALEQVAMIVSQNTNSKNDGQYDVQNIIAFVGRRGTGKTSAMYSFAKFLSSHLFDFASYKGCGKVEFKTLANIDASTLDKNVNIIPAVLSEIISYLEIELRSSACCRDNNERKTTSVRSLYDRANELFNSYITGIGVLSEKSDASNYFSITSKRLSFGKEFRGFIKSCADYCFINNENSYFIVCIDDVHMSSGNHAELLESIHKYLMIPNIIVMVTANLKYLSPELQTMFYNNIKPAYNNNSIDKISREQTEDYLKKIIPSDNRITLPSWKKKDYLTMFPIYISFGTESKNELLKGIFSELRECEYFKFVEKSEFYRVTPKQFILMMIANRTKIYFDINGQKYHFFEPSSLRNLYDLFYILYNMNNIVAEYSNRKGKKPNDYYLHRSQNRKRLLDYIHFVMRHNYNFDENDFIDDLLAQPVERRGKIVWERYYSLLGTESISKRIDSVYEDGFRVSEIYYHKASFYSFGEFFRILFASSRLNIFDNELRKFLLASFSFSVPSLVENEKRESKDKKYKQLISLFGSSLLGNWCDELFGCRFVVKTYIGDKNTKQYLTSYQAKRCNIIVKPDTTITISQIEILILFLLLSPHWAKQEQIQVLKQDNKNNDYKYIIKADIDPTSFLINGLLIEEKTRDEYGFGVECKNGYYPFEFIMDSSKPEKKSLNKLLTEIFGKATISIPDFEDIDSPDYVKDYHKSIKNFNGQTVEKAVGFDSNKTIDQEPQKTLTEVILDYLSLDYSEYHLSNMLKHVDLTYNSIKRAVTDIIYKTPDDIIKKQRFDNKEDPSIIITDLYKNLIDQLEVTDKVYFADGTNAPNSFATRFKKSAFVEKVLNYPNKKYKETEKGIYLESVPINLIMDFHEKNEGITLRNLLDEMLSAVNFYEGDSEFLSAIKGFFIFELEKLITKKQAKDITDSIRHYLSLISSSYLLINRNNKNKIVKELLEYENQAYNEIRSILGLEEHADTT